MFSKISETICDRLIRKITCISQFFFSMYVHGNFSVTTWCYSTQNWKPLPSASSTQILSAEASLWLFWFFLVFLGCTEIPSSYGNVTMGIGEATRFWSGWFERLFGSNTLLSRKLKHQTFRRWSIWQSKLIRFPFTSPELQLKIKRVGLILLAYGREKNIQEKNTLKHCCCRVLLGFQGDIRNIQKHMDTVDTRVLAIVWKELPFPIIEVEPHLFTLISIPDFVVTFGLNQHPLPANFFLSRHRSGTAP